MSMKNGACAAETLASGAARGYLRPMRTFAALVVALALVVTGATLAMASGGGGGHANASHQQYGVKQGCTVKKQSGYENSAFNQKNGCPKR